MRHVSLLVSAEILFNVSIQQLVIHRDTGLMGTLHTDFNTESVNGMF